LKIRLTQKYIASLEAPDKPYRITDTECRNLFLNVGPKSKTWYVYYRDENGKGKNHKLGPAGEVLTVAAARDMANEFIMRLHKGEAPQKKNKKENITLGEFLTRDYEPWVTTERKSGKQTLYLLRLSFAQFLDAPICELTVRMMEKWRQDTMNTGTKSGKKANTKAATCNRRLTSLKAALNWGARREYIESNPLTRLEKLPEYGSGSKARYLSDDERKRLMAALDAREKRIRDERKSHIKWLEERGYSLVPELAGEFADHFKPMILLSLHTGMRQGNLFALLWGDVDFENKIITLRDEATKAGKTLHIPMNGNSCHVLESWREQSPNKEPGGFVFPSPKSGGILNNVKKGWAAILKDAKIENFRWHDMRHDFASQLVMKGVDLNTVRELLGYEDDAALRPSGAGEQTQSRESPGGNIKRNESVKISL
jgi:integrase